MDTNNNNPLDPGLGSTPSTSDTVTDTPVAVPDLGAPVSPTPDPAAAPASDAQSAPMADVPAPDMGVPAPEAEAPAPAPVADMPPAAPANDAPVGFDPAVPGTDSSDIGGDEQYKADVAAASTQFNADMDKLDEKYPGTSPTDSASSVPTEPAPAAEVPAPEAETTNQG